MGSNLVLHKGARRVGLEELLVVPAPPGEGRWYPLSHGAVLNRVKETLGEAGYEVKREDLALSRGNARFFGTLDLNSPLADGVGLSVGVRNSTDKSFPIGFVAGNRVFCCDNLAFRSDLISVRRKHTRYGEQRFALDIAAAMTSLDLFRESEAERIEAMQTTEVDDTRAESLILRAFERGIITAPTLPGAIREWRKPSHEEFQPRTYFSLMNAVTTALGEKARKNPSGYAVTTVRLNALFTEDGRFAPSVN
jgi:hypothetical protein